MFRYVSTDGAPLRKAKSRSGPDKGQWRWEHLDHRQWCSGTGKHTPLPYRWNEAVELVADRTTLMVTEGESDADAVTQWAEFYSMGVVAMSLPNGASNHPSEEADAWLRSLDRFVVMIDNDDAGEKRGDWFRSEYPNVTIERPSHGKDVYEMLSLGHVTEDDFVPFTSGDDLVIEPFAMLGTLEPREFLIPDFVHRKTLGMVYGLPGSGKSVLVLDWALSVAGGRSWCDRPVKQGRVLWIAAEGEDELWDRRLAWESIHGPAAIENIDIVRSAVHIAEAERQEV